MKQPFLPVRETSQPWLARHRRDTERLCHQPMRDVRGTCDRMDAGRLADERPDAQLNDPEAVLLRVQGRNVAQQGAVGTRRWAHPGRSVEFLRLS
ncbi:hypothetical protein [Isoptericola croceus]|uniref:hypothetical protein n=1 Tax=Isoptericola croceus TaxID=3031406 RepID=UPI0023F97330|nr:hypothetical protein [Isoptericola croceus]